MEQGTDTDAPYATPRQAAGFGDLFEADFLLDLFVREDATFLGGGQLAGQKLIARLGGWMNAEGIEAEAVDLFSPAFAVRAQDRFALGHASHRLLQERRLALLISDSCLTATALAQGRAKRSPGGRLLFAPVSQIDPDEWERLRQEPDFERFPLPPEEAQGLTALVAELRHVFMVDAKHLAAHLDSRLLSLAPATAESLEAHWAAYATRRGPLAYERNTLKLAFLLAGGAQPGEEEQRSADAIAEVLDLTWLLEGKDLEDVSEAEEQVRLEGAQASALLPDLKLAIAARLHELSTLATQAAERL